MHRVFQVRIHGRDGQGRATAAEFDLDYCKGYVICVEECPCGAIEVEPEPI
jgi:Pyruvate/2-oxoacid:ferredoxin oxidoreductase delta subunit